jgi:hypothetical protein
MRLSFKKPNVGLNIFKFTNPKELIVFFARFLLIYLLCYATIPSFCTHKLQSFTFEK